MRTKHGETAHPGWLPYRFVAPLVAVGCALAYGGKQAIIQAAQQPPTLSNQLAGGCALLGIVGYSWIVLVVALSLGEHLSGRPGQLAHSCARLVAPAGWRRSVRLACGVAAIAVPVVGLVGVEASADKVTSSPLGHANVASLTRSSHHDAIRLDGLPMPERPAGGRVGPQLATRLVVVRVGDTLWQIAARHLGLAASEATVAAEWPRWYAANRSVIGDDPGLIIPGTVLRPPEDAQVGMR